MVNKNKELAVNTAGRDSAVDHIPDDVVQEV